MTAKPHGVHEVRLAEATTPAWYTLHTVHTVYHTVRIPLLTSTMRWYMYMNT